MGLASFAKKVGSPIVEIGSERHTQYLAATGEFAGNSQRTALDPSPTQPSSPKGSTQTNVSRGVLDNAGGKDIGVASAMSTGPSTFGALGSGNTEVQNDDVLLPYAKL